MKIAHLSVFYPFRGGISQFNGHVFRQLSKNHAIKAFNFSLQYPNFLFPGKSQFVTKDDTKVDQIPTIRTLNSVNPLSYLSTAKQINRFNPDLLITRFWMPFLGPSLGTVGKLVRSKETKVICVVDNLIPHEQRFFDRPFTKYFLQSVDACLSMSHSVTNDILSLAPNMKIVGHPHPVYDHFGELQSKEAAQAKLNIPKGKKVLLFFGLIRAYKGLDLLINAMKELSEEYYLVIAGEPYEDFSNYQTLIENSGAKDRIQAHTRYIATEEVSLLFSAADAGVLPYKSATQSGVAAMAFHFNLPVVVTNTGGLKEMIEPHQIGIIAKEPNVSEVVRSIEQLFESNTEISKISENIKNFKANNNWETFSNLIVETYNSLK